MKPETIVNTKEEFLALAKDGHIFVKSLGIHCEIPNGCGKDIKSVTVINDVHFEEQAVIYGSLSCGGSLFVEKGLCVCSDVNVGRRST
jgi:hypothetical protein